jgi:uncharacterized protein (UPF0333 family)
MFYNKLILIIAIIVFTVVMSTCKEDDQNQQQDIRPFLTINDVEASWDEIIDIIKNGGNDKNYNITVTGNVGIPGLNSNTDEHTFGTVYNLTVTINGSGTLFLNSRGSLILINAGQTIILDGENLTLRGIADNGWSVVWLDGNKWELIEEQYVNLRARMILKNGSITGNKSYYGAIVLVNGEFIMEGGSIYGNNSTNCGGGVSIMYNSSFTMSGGSINNNTATNVGGGVHMQQNATFNMLGGVISNNTNTGLGGGVGCGGNSRFNMTNGIISGNNASRGGGIYLEDTNVFFSKDNEGIIYGNNASPNNNRNVSKQGDTYGHAIFLSKDSNFYYCDYTLSTTQNINTDIIPSVGGVSNALGNWIKK